MSLNAASSRPGNTRIALICAAVFVFMVGAAFAAVPLYRMFCQITGFGGAVSRADAAPTRILARKVSVRFDTNVRGLPWTFVTEQGSQNIRIGDTGLAFFKVTNTSDKVLTGRASYNVVPEQAGAYFRKLECFCFLDQTLKPGQSLDFPVVYFIDPQYADDFETKGASEITLSYTFFPVENSPVAPGA
jgi:cytochrome c oxidase assembly protein subunit 11